MRTTMLSPAGHGLVQGMTAPPVFMEVEDALTPDPTAATVRLDMYEAYTGDRILDGSLGAISVITSEVKAYGTLYSFYLEHDWVVGELDLLTGPYDVQFRVTFATGEIQAIPQTPARVFVSPRTGAGAGIPVTPSATVYQEKLVNYGHGGFVVGDIIYPSGGGAWALADASAWATLGTNIVTSVPDAASFYYAGPGCIIVFPTDQGWTPGDPLYLDPASNGKLTQVQPTLATYPGQWAQQVGIADSSIDMSFQLYAAWRV